MGFTAIVSGIFAIAKAVPMVASYIDKFIDLYIDQKIDKTQKIIFSHQEKRKAIYDAINKATTNEERSKLSVILFDISK